MYGYVGHHMTNNSLFTTIMSVTQPAIFSCAKAGAAYRSMFFSSCYCLWYYGLLTFQAKGYKIGKINISKENYWTLRIGVISDTNHVWLNQVKLFFWFWQFFSTYSKALRCTFFGEWKNSCISKFVQLELLNKAKARSSKNRAA